MDKKLKKLFLEKFEKARFSSKKGGYVFKTTYFWGMTKDSLPYGEKKVKLVEQFLLDNGVTNAIVKLVDHSNNYHSWPKDSWFEAVVSITIPGVTNVG